MAACTVNSPISFPHAICGFVVDMKRDSLDKIHDKKILFDSAKSGTSVVRNEIDNRVSIENAELLLLNDRMQIY